MHNRRKRGFRDDGFGFRGNVECTETFAHSQVVGIEGDKKAFSGTSAIKFSRRRLFVEPPTQIADHLFFVIVIVSSEDSDEIKFTFSVLSGSFELNSFELELHVMLRRWGLKNSIY